MLETILVIYVVIGLIAWFIVLQDKNSTALEALVVSATWIIWFTWIISSITCKSLGKLIGIEISLKAKRKGE